TVPCRQGRGAIAGTEAQSGASRAPGCAQSFRARTRAACRPSAAHSPRTALKAATVARKKIIRPRGKVGLAPGSLVYTGDKTPLVPRVTMLDYDEHRVVEKELVRVDDCIPFKDAQAVTWINVDSVTQPGLLENFGRVMGFHALMLEDILNIDQRPKFEDYGNYIYIVVKMLDYDAKKSEIEIEQLSLIVGPNYVISFQERAGDF